MNRIILLCILLLLCRKKTQEVTLVTERFKVFDYCNFKLGFESLGGDAVQCLSDYALQKQIAWVQIPVQILSCVIQASYLTFLHLFPIF